MRFIFPIQGERGIGTKNIEHRGFATVFEMNLLAAHGTLRSDLGRGKAPHPFVSRLLGTLF